MAECGQPRALACLPRLVDLADPPLGAGEILRAPEELCHRGFAVAAGAAGFLIIGLDRLGHGGVRHEANVRLVDAHAEGDGGDHHHILGRHEIALVARAHAGVEPGVIGAYRAAAARDLRRDLVGGVAGGGVDDASAGLIGDERLELGGQPVAGRDGVADVRPVEAGDDQPIIGNAELLEDVGAGMRVRRSGEREPRHVRKGIEQRAQQTVIGAEVVPPFGDAMRLVDREQRERGRAQQATEALARGAFGRDIEQVQLAVAEAAHRLGAIIVGGGERRGFDAEPLGRADLIVHQRDQRRHNHGRAVPRQSRQLIAKRLARAGRHHRQCAAPGHHAIDHRLLDAAKAGKAEGGVKDIERRGDHRGGVSAWAPLRHPD